MSQITRGRNLSRIGLREQDLEDRIVIAVGYMPGELLPPYRDVRPKNVRRIVEYLKGKRFKKSRYSLHDIDIRRRFREPPKVVEVVGALAHCCVAVTVHYFIEAGSRVYIDPEMISTSVDYSYPPYWSGRILLGQMLSRQPERRCFVYRGRFIFYNKRN